jgi:hypothetical protein
VQAAVVDLVPALPAEGPQQIGCDSAAPVALAAVHDLAGPGGLDHELGYDHVPLVGRDSRNVTSRDGRDWRVVCSSAPSTSHAWVFVQSPGALEPAALPSLEVKVGKLSLTRPADPGLREASK